jgi:hypothetical protein
MSAVAAGFWKTAAGFLEYITAYVINVVVVIIETYVIVNGFGTRLRLLGTQLNISSSHKRLCPTRKGHRMARRATPDESCLRNIFWTNFLATQT